VTKWHQPKQVIPRLVRFSHRLALSPSERNYFYHLKKFNTTKQEMQSTKQNKKQYNKLFHQNQTQNSTMTITTQQKSIYYAKQNHSIQLHNIKKNKGMIIFIFIFNFFPS